MKLAYGNYGMPQTPVATMIEQVASIGYDGLEICVAPGYPTAPDQLTGDARHALRTYLQDHGLEIASFLLVKVPVLTTDPIQKQASLDYLRRVCELRNALGVEVEVSSTLGGKTDDWEQQCDLLAEAVHDWAVVAAEHETPFAFEAHVGGLVHTPDRALWLLHTVNHPNLKVNFDYSHFELVDITLEESITKLISHAAGVHVKDVQGRYPDFRFLLPGEGTLDYADYLHQLQVAGYTGFVTVEVSGQIFNAPDYDAFNAAVASYRTLTDAFVRAGLSRQPV